MQFAVVVLQSPCTPDVVDDVHSDMLSMPLENKEDLASAVELLKTSDEYDLPRLKVAIERRLHRCALAAVK